MSLGIEKKQEGLVTAAGSLFRWLWRQCGAGFWAQFRPKLCQGLARDLSGLKKGVIDGFGLLIGNL